MNAEFKEKWIKALRSNDYQQVEGMLRGERDDSGDIGFCCLGVLCDALGAQWSEGGVALLDDIRLDSEDEYLLSDKMIDMVGLSFDEQRHLSRMNDSGESFIEIADYIDQNL